MTVAIHWFRKGCRLHDNPALLHASQDNVSVLIPLYILDPYFQDPKQISVNRYAHLLETLDNLDINLKKKGSRLFVVQGKPLEIFPLLIKQFKVDLITFERDSEPYAKERDPQVVKLAKSAGVKEITSFVSGTLYDPECLLKIAGGKPPLTMPVFMSILSQAGPPPLPVKSPNKLPKPPSMDRFNKIKGLKTYKSVPTLLDLAEFGYDPNGKTTYFIGGEDEAIKRMDRFLSQTRRVAKFEKPKTLPTTLEPDTTALSPYIKFGALSVRYFLSRIKEVYKKCGRNHTLPPVSLEGQLYWREMAYLVATSTPNFDKMVNNPICKQISWKTGPEAEKLLHKWEFGQTGTPSVDAVMNQLRNEGWMHHLARHLVSCFLTRGDLWLHWEAGRGVFDRYLLDSDYAMNNFHWHWMSCSALFHQYFRCYKPATFFQKMDPKGDYVRKHVPILKSFPDEFIYKPWLAPMDVQIKSNCIIGKDYPKPAVEHTIACKENMAKMRIAYEQARKIREKEGDIDCAHRGFDGYEGGYGPSPSNGPTRPKSPKYDEAGPSPKKRKQR